MIYLLQIINMGVVWMISSEKIRCMTDVAMLWKKGKRREAEVCKYRRKDYIALHMFGVWVISSRLLQQSTVVAPYLG